jgi:general secretion pathway protein J
MKNKCQGFTLLEILIAVAILSIIAIMMVRGLQIVMVSKNRIDAANSTIEEMQLALTMISQDLDQFVNRPVLDNAGNIESALLINTNPATLSFTRGGYVNPEGAAKRSTLQRVRYQLSGLGLERVTWPVLDRLESTPSCSRVLLKNVSSVTLRFVANDHRFYKEWPQQGQTIPNGIEMDITLSNGKQLKRLFRLNVTEPPKEDTTQASGNATQNLLVGY